MKDEFAEYLRSIGITDVLKERIVSIYQIVERVCPEEIDDIFVTDYIKDDASRDYENLWFFSKKHVMEIRQFISKDDFDICPTYKQIGHLIIRKKDYDFENATQASRLSIEFQMHNWIEGNLRASRENCDYLKSILLKHIVPNLLE